MASEDLIGKLGRALHDAGLELVISSSHQPASILYDAMYQVCIVGAVFHELAQRSSLRYLPIKEELLRLFHFLASRPTSLQGFLAEYKTGGRKQIASSAFLAQLTSDHLNGALRYLIVTKEIHRNSNEILYDRNRTSGLIFSVHDHIRTYGAFGAERLAVEKLLAANVKLKDLGAR